MFDESILCWLKNNRAPVHSIRANVLTKEMSGHKLYVCFGLEDGQMKRQIRRIIASMLAVTMVLSNSNLTVFAGETGSENEPVVEGQGNLDSALTSASEENAGEAVKENESNAPTEEEQQESGSNIQSEEQQEMKN